jgi:TPR repeat protein
MDSETLFLEGFKCEEGLGVAKDYEKAFEFYSKAADLHYAPAQNALALMYWFRKGKPKDLEKAIDYLQKAVKQNNLMACCHLARLYEDGFIKETDSENSLLLKQKVLCMEVSQPHPSDKYHMVKMLIYHLECQWKADSQVKMGSHFSSKNDFNKAVNLFLEASLLPSPEALFQVGVHSEMNKDEKKAFEYYTKASDLNYEKSFSKLACCHETGIGTPIDYVNAMKWFRKAGLEGEVERVAKEQWKTVANFLIKK